ncbi:MAG: hypothetical protein HYZ51_04775 [Candidatus Doudnabacteria bacterium]|nr:hypothetical protein [Candidatus Doudnabacteria bacterium]
MTFSPIANLLIAGIYYVLVVLMVFFSAFGVYVLVRYAEKRGIALIVGLLYVFFFLSMLAQSYSSLQNII